MLRVMITGFAAIAAGLVASWTLPAITPAEAAMTTAPDMASTNVRIDEGPRSASVQPDAAGGPAPVAEPVPAREHGAVANPARTRRSAVTAPGRPKHRRGADDDDD